MILPSPMYKGQRLRRESSLNCHFAIRSISFDEAAMALKKGDILDERKRYPDSCGLVIKLAGGGEGFQKIRCCGHELTEEDVVTDILPSRGRKKGGLLPGAMLEEKRQFADSCGLRVMVLDGGAGFEGIDCCGHTITAGAVNDWKFGQTRQAPPMPTGPTGTA